MIRKRGKNSWEIRIECGRDPATGKRLLGYHTFQGTAKEAQQEERRLLVLRDQNNYARPSHMTVSQWLSKWLSDYRDPNWTQRTLQGYEDLIRLHLSPTLGDIRLDKVTALDIQALVATKQRNGRNDGKGALSGQTVLHIYRLLNQVFACAVNFGVLHKNPCGPVKAPKAKRTEAKALTHDEIAELRKAVAGTRFQMPVALDLATGLRRGELLALRWPCVDLDAEALDVVQALSETKVGIEFKAPKSEKSRRTVALPANAVIELRQHLKAQQEHRLLLGPGYQDNDLVFPAWDGTPWKPSLFSGAFADLVRKTTIRGATFHSLRHTSISLLLMQGEPLKVVSARAGHSSIAITADIYGHLLPGADQKAAEALDWLLYAPADQAA